MSEEPFQAAYAKAFEKLSEDEKEFVVNLSKSKIKEWVNTPENVRPYLLKKWIAENQKYSERIGESKKRINEIKQRLFAQPDPNSLKYKILKFLGYYR